MTLEFAKLGLDHIATHNIYAAGNDSNNNSTMIQETRIGLIQVKIKTMVDTVSSKK